MGQKSVMMDFCEEGNKAWGFLEAVEFPEQLSNYQLLKEDTILVI
jgi:hypothetical protein